MVLATPIRLTRNYCAFSTKHPVTNLNEDKEMKVKTIIFSVVALVGISSSANALDCTGTVTKTLDWPSKCGGNMAYAMTNTSGVWLCTLSKASDAMILTSMATGKTITTRLDTVETCNTLSTHYMTPTYIITNN